MLEFSRLIKKFKFISKNHLTIKNTLTNKKCVIFTNIIENTICINKKSKVVVMIIRGKSEISIIVVIANEEADGGNE